MEVLRCVVERITYQNAENGFAVIRCRAKGHEDLVTVTGEMPDVHAGSVLLLEGEWRIDPRYGRQFAVKKYEEALPATAYGIEKYLGSGLVRGVGPKSAQRIVKQFGTETLNIIEDQPERLTEVSGIGRVRAEKIRQSWQEQKEIRGIMLFLQSHDVSTAHASRIFRTYGKDSIDIVTENPYRLADDIWGIGFKTADTIAAKLGFGREKYARLRSGLLYTLNRLADEGHCCVSRKMLLKTGGELLETGGDVLSDALDEMIRSEDVSVENNEEDVMETLVYLPAFRTAEENTAVRLAAIMRAKAGSRISTDGLEERVRLLTGMEYDETQMRAIRGALSGKVLVLTGGPGTGKTTTTLGIIAALRQAGAKVLLAAPTGRAARRLSEVSGMEAKTLHRLLEYKPPQGYQKNEESPLAGDVLIVDECSMIDIILMYSLLKAVPDRMRLILIGDADQLPSVGAGNVLRDIIDSGCFPVVKLTRIFRQAQNSRIIMNAHRINAGRLPDISNGPDSDFFFIDMEKVVRNNHGDPSDTEQLSMMTAETIRELVRDKLPAYCHVPPAKIQVLTPMQRGAVGAAMLNRQLQEAVNPGEEGLRRGGYLFRTGDKVMQIRNNYEKEVFNGDIGTVELADIEDLTLRVRFDERTAEYDVSELDELVLAYAVTVHKSQGSEYPVVVMPVMMNHYVMLQRNLIYTGVTRAKQTLVICGTRKALGYAVNNVTVTRRGTLLKERLIRLCGNAEEASGLPAYPQEAKMSHEEWLKIDLGERLGRSAFRQRFRLREADREYIREKGPDVIRRHAREIVAKRLAPADIPNDGKQTPMRGAPSGHPVFLAQHATGTCCRECLWKWHGIPKGRKLTEAEQEKICDVLMKWIEGQTE